MDEEARMSAKVAEVSPIPTLTCDIMQAESKT